MRERPILFSAPMIRAILAGAKTQTRRLVKPNPHKVDGGVPFTDAPAWAHAEPGSAVMRCPYGVRGDRLWVREAHAFSACDPEGRNWRDDPGNWDVIYRADLAQPAGGWRDADGNVVPAPWRPSIHMPRWASRITLEVTAVRVEQLQEISYDDAKAEGAEFWRNDGALTELPPCSAHRYEFEDLWTSIYGADSWNANPWVWAVSFRRLDQQAKAATT